MLMCVLKNLDVCILCTGYRNILINLSLSSRGSTQHSREGPKERREVHERDGDLLARRCRAAGHLGRPPAHSLARAVDRAQHHSSHTRLKWSEGSCILVLYSTKYDALTSVAVHFDVRLCTFV